MVGRPTSKAEGAGIAERATIAKRRTEAIKLKLAGFDHVTIGRRLACDPAVNKTGRIQHAGYGASIWAAGLPPPDDARLKALVAQDLRRALSHCTASMEFDQDYLRAIEDARLEKLFNGIWDDCLAGDLNAIDRALRIMGRKAKLLGLDAYREIGVANEHQKREHSRTSPPRLMPP